MKSFVALSVILLATSASSLITLPLTKLRGTGAYLKRSPDTDRARAALLKLRADDGPTAVPATSIVYGAYTTKVGIGNPPTYYNLMVDTGSSTTFCGANGALYVQSSTSIPTGENVSVNYAIGNFTGKEYLDQVTLAPNLVITNQSIGDAYSADVLGDGILGLGPRDLTLGTFSPNSDMTVPTVMNNLVLQGLIENQVLGVYFAPPTDYYDDTNGALTYGGTDSSLYEGELTWVPVTETRPASNYWGVDITSCTYGDNAITETSTTGIVDTGTTQVLLADDFFSVYMDAIPGASILVVDSNTGILEIPTSSITHMRPLNFTMAGRVFSMDVAAQLFPAAQGGNHEKRHGTVGRLGRSSGQGFDFNLGLGFLERYYSVFDADGKRIGFAQTNNTFS